MNKLIETIPGDPFHKKIGLVMNSHTEYQDWLRAVPNPVSPTHCQMFEWGKVGNADVLWIYPAPHPLETVAQVTNHFETLDTERLTYLCKQAKIETEGVKLSQNPDDGLPKTLDEALRAMLREKCPLPKGAKVLPPPPAKAIQVREQVIVLSADLAAADLKTLEKRAGRANALNAFKVIQGKGATLPQLRAFVAQAEDRQKQGQQRQQNTNAGVLQKA